MSARDPVVAILGSLERPVQPRPEFAEGLLSRLLEELGDARAPARGRWRATFRLPRILPGAPPRLRIVLIVIALLLLLAGIATATYLGVRTWVSAGPRGVQYSSDFRLTRVFRNEPPRTGFWAFALGPGGRDIYALSQPPPLPQRRTELVRIPGVATARAPVKAEQVLSFDDLSEPRFWDPGTEVVDSVVGEYHGGHLSGDEGTARALTVSENGDVFVTAGVWPKRDELDFLAPPASAAVLVRHADGSVEKVVTIRELVGEALPGASPDEVGVEIAASEPGLLWVKARAVVPPLDAGFGKTSIVEVRDPNGDGDWNDRVLRRLAVPASVPLADRAPQGWTRTYVVQLVAEPSGAEGSPSILLTTLGREGEFRIYRITDRNGDGDALDGGETTRLLTGNVDFGLRHPVIATRVVVDDGKVVLKEIVAARLTLSTRLSRISESGELTDFGRSFFSLEHVLAGPDGSIYAVVQRPDARPRPHDWSVYRFQPVKVGEERDAAPAPTLAVPTTAQSGEQSIPRLAFAIESFEPSRGEIVTIRADGRRGPRRFVPGRHNHGFCQSADGRKMAFFSDEEAPNEEFLYLANADGSHARKLTERRLGFWCGFGKRWFLLTEQTGSAMTLIRRDLKTGKETELVKNVDRLALSPDGNTLVFVGGLDFSSGVPPTGKETLELLDLDTLERRRLVGPLRKGSYGATSGFSLRWSPDGTRVAYVTGPWGYPVGGEVLGPETPPASALLTVRDVRSGARVFGLRIMGGPPAISWSPEGRRLLVCVPARGAEGGCNGGLPNARHRARLLLVDLASGRSLPLTSGKLLFAGWAHDGRYAYSTERTLFVVAPDRSVRRFAAPPVDGWPAGTWLGFSPDGRYIGLGDFSKRLAVLDVASGRVRVLVRERKSEFIEYRKWWR